MRDFLLVSVLIIVCSEVARAALQHWDYVVVGAGPSGLQMAYFLHRANRDYVVLEKANTSGKQKNTSGNLNYWPLFQPMSSPFIISAIPFSSAPISVSISLI